MDGNAEVKDTVDMMRNERGFTLMINEYGRYDNFIKKDI